MKKENKKMTLYHKKFKIESDYLYKFLFSRKIKFKISYNLKNKIFRLGVPTFKPH